jgi:hypothetical protein
VDEGVTFVGVVATVAALGLVPFLLATTVGFTGGVADNFKATVAVSNFPEVSGRNVWNSFSKFVSTPG